MGRILTELDDILELVDDGTGGDTPLRYSDSYNLLTTGQGVFPRGFISSAGVALGASQTLRLAYFTSTKAETTTQVRVLAGGTGAGATPTLCRIGLYSIAANGDGTLIASTANDTTLFGTPSTAYTKSWSAPVALTLGARYAVGILVVSAATMPTFCGQAVVGAAAEWGLPPRVTGAIAGQADLPASFLAASSSDSLSRIFSAVLP